MRQISYEEFLEMFGEKRKDKDECIAENICYSCGGDAHDFKQPNNLQEYYKDGLCQNCQDALDFYF